MSNVTKLPAKRTDWAIIKEGFRESMERMGVPDRVVGLVLDDLKACHDQVVAVPAPEPFVLNVPTLYSQQQLGEIEAAANKAAQDYNEFISGLLGLTYAHLVNSSLRAHGF